MRKRSKPGLTTVKEVMVLPVQEMGAVTRGNEGEIKAVHFLQPMLSTDDIVDFLAEFENVAAL